MTGAIKAGHTQQQSVTDGGWRVPRCPLGLVPLLIGLILWIDVGSTSAQTELSQGEFELLQRVLEPRVDRERLGCAYTQHSYDEEGGFTSERFDPLIDDANPWYLVEIDGNAPTIEQLDSYKPTARERHPAILDFGLIDFESLKHAAREGQTSNYSFKINPDYSSVMNESLEGSLTVNLFREELTNITIKSSQPFTVNEITKIEDFEQLMDFEYGDSFLGPMLSTLTMRLHGQTMGEKFNGKIDLVFEDFECRTEISHEDVRRLVP